MVFPLKHPARIWCQPSLNQVKDFGFQILGFNTWPKKYQVENTGQVMYMYSKDLKCKL
jgi:hypothetical protein